MEEWEKLEIRKIENLAAQFMERHGFHKNKIIEEIRGDTVVSYTNQKGIKIVFNYYFEYDILILFKKKLLYLLFNPKERNRVISMKKYMNINQKIIDYGDFIEKAFQVIEKENLIEH